MAGKRKFEEKEKIFVEKKYILKNGENFFS